MPNADLSGIRPVIITGTFETTSRIVSIVLLYLMAAQLLYRSILLAQFFSKGRVSKMSTSKVDVDGLIDEGREKLSDMADQGMEYITSANSFLTDFIRDEPLIAIAGAFAVGYVAARVLNYVTRR